MLFNLEIKMVGCPSCKSDNPDGAKFCNSCGHKIEFICPNCNQLNPQSSKFCNECGTRLLEPDDSTSQDASESEIEEPVGPQITEPGPAPENTCAEGERKYATVLFSDLSGYTAMSEELDLEEVKSIMGRIFGEVAQVVAKYDGHIDKFIGDSAMAIFGVPACHEDDAIRAILAAQEIHAIVEKISPEIQPKIGRALTMHTGINTGLIITGKMDTEKGVSGAIGDTINVASRLEGLAGSGEILIGYDTRIQAENIFNFEDREPTKVKGKSTPIKVYKVLGSKTQPRKSQRLQGMRAKLIGRKMVFSRLKEIISLPEKGKGAIVSICGDAGTGKSRLVDELKRSVNQSKYQWFEGYAYSYAQNISYFPLINLLNKVFKVREEDSPSDVKSRLSDGLDQLLPGEDDAIPIIEVLYSVRDKDADEINPQFWMLKLREIIQKIIMAISHQAPTIICLEDLHWADPSSMELITSILTEIRTPILILCVFRPTITLFNDEQRKKISNTLHEVELKDLSPSESHEMVESLLKTDTIPPDLREFIENKTEGNPFYLEEMINSMIESGVLVNEDGVWNMARKISGSDISSTIHGVITARIDRLKTEPKQILQEASVIGRSFYRQVLRRITEIEEGPNDSLENLQSLDLVKEKGNDPEIEYIFKHALTQEVVYNGLLKTERQVIHERIGIVIEQLFKDRLPEFYETLAYHFSRAGNILKAVEYLVESGEKSLRRYSVDEAHLQFKEAFELIVSVSEKSNAQKELLIDLLNKWALVYYYLGDFGRLDALLASQKEYVASIADKEKCGMFYVWEGAVLHSRGKPYKAYESFKIALEIGEKDKIAKVIRYACAWLAWSCAEMGLFDKGISYGKKGTKISKSITSDPYPYFKSLGGIGYNYFYIGNSEKCLKIGRALIEYGNNNSLIRCLVFGHIYEGSGYLLAGDFSLAKKSYIKAKEVACDPFYSLLSELYLGLAFAQSDCMEEVVKIIEKSIPYCDAFGNEQVGDLFYSLSGFVLLDKGNLGQGLTTIKETMTTYSSNNRKSMLPIVEQMIGKIYLKIIKGEKKLGPLTILNNIGFIIQNVPFAVQKAEYHYGRAITLAEEIGAVGTIGQAHLDLGTIYKIKKKNAKAIEHLEKAIPIFKETGAYVYLEQAEDTLASLKSF